MSALSYLSRKTVVRESPIHGRGLFAKTAIDEGEIVAVKGGHIITRATLAELQTRLGPAEIQIGDDLFIGPTTEEEREGAMIFSNHSCAPNLGLRGEITFVAMRGIAAGEELTHDWAMTDDDESVTVCQCGASSCRGRITGKDWQRPELQARYGGYFSSYLLAKMRTTMALLICAGCGVLTSAGAEQELEAVMEEVIVEAPFDVRLQLPQESAVQNMIERIRLRTESERAAELAIANRSPITTILDLTRYSPIKAGASEDRVDTFFLENALRADLNPRERDPLALGR